MPATKDTSSNDGLCWTLLGAWVTVTLTSLFAPSVLSFDTSRYINVALMSAYTFAHGAPRYGWRGISVYFTMAVVVAYVAENASVATGFPFGVYQHTAHMGPQLGRAPILVGPIFAVAGYLGWVLAGILLGDAFVARRLSPLVARPLIAAFITTSWDLCVDPIGGTMNRDWIWADGGGYFGVGWMNFFGWMLTMGVIFQLFGLWLERRAAPASVIRSFQYWFNPVLFWLLIALQFPLLFAIVPDFALKDPTGKAWQAADLLETMMLASVFTMLFTAVLSLFLLLRWHAAGDTEGAGRY